jgi:hypothetical protein
MLALFLALMPTLVVGANGACVAPAVVSAVPDRRASNGELNTFGIAVTVKNAGSVNEPSALLQSVQVFQNGDKVGQIGTRSLAAGASQTVTYTFTRATGTQRGSTHLRFRVVTTNPHNLPIAICHGGTESYTLNV